ncbi:UNVERIFIED_CONTAM: hypothetical protein ABIC26_002741 [Paenibacillus sp. PvR008]
MIRLLVYNKAFGQPFVKYKVVDDVQKIVIDEGKYKEYEQIVLLNARLKDVYGKDNVMLLSR